ncbi:MAG: SufD family Fe-S cluster assembly protein [Spirochaetia bacterium]|nr:SufD family Fe-S cluster assembly protein [Spirochaetia bacterium]
MPNIKSVVKKKKNSEYLEDLSKIIPLNGLSDKFPEKSWETWRRFDPSLLLPIMLESAREGVYKLPLLWKEINEDVTSCTKHKNFCENVKVLKEWEKTDFKFAQKVKDSLKKLNYNNEAAFFSQMANNITPWDETPVFRISKNSSMENPLHFLYAPKKDIKYFYSNSLIIYAEENSSASICLESFSEGFNLYDTRVYLEDNASLNLHCLIREGIGSNTTKHSAWVWNKNVYCRSSSNFTQSFFSAGGKLGKMISEVFLNDNSSAQIYGIHVGNHSHVDHDFNVKHFGSRSTSNLEFNMALLDNAYGVFRGKLNIPKDYRVCKAEQTNKNLLLGEKSRADSIPMLEVLSEEVECSHGSATGELSDEEMFYLQSRGLNETQAKQLLLLGFFENILQKALKHTQDKAAYNDPFLHDIWCAIQDRSHINFERTYTMAET